MASLEDEKPGRALLTALGAMAGVALLIGLVIGGVAAFALRGVVSDESTPDQGRADASLFLPEYVPTKGADADPDIPGIKKTPDPLITTDETEAPDERKVTLFVAPQSVGTGERINFNGVYPGGEGVVLQIQRREGGRWVDFPVDATVRGGSFETWIQTSRTGKQVFRVYDEDAHRASKTVTVTVS